MAGDLRSGSDSSWVAGISFHFLIREMEALKTQLFLPASWLLPLPPSRGEATPWEAFLHQGPTQPLLRAYLSTAHT